MTKIIVNSDEGLSRAIGHLRDEYATHRYVEMSTKAGTARSISQNSITHVWYGLIAAELRQDDALGWKCYCKLHFGVPILRAEDEEFREAYDLVIKPLKYEQKIIAMRCWPVTSIMRKAQLSKYAEAVQADFATKGVILEFPKDQ